MKRRSDEVFHRPEGEMTFLKCIVQTIAVAPAALHAIARLMLKLKRKV